MDRVPEGWCEVNLGNMIIYKKGYAFKSTDYLEQGVQLVRISDTSRNSIHNNNPVFISKNVASSLKNQRLSEGDIILTTVGSRPHLIDSMVGKAIQIPSSAEGSLLNQNLVKISPKNDKIINSFLYLTLIKPEFIYFISTLVRGNANQVSITLSELFQHKFLLPPLAEQKKIAKILLTWDKAINTTQALIDVSKQQKKALMQQLLTGKKRFSESCAEWRIWGLNEIATIIVSPVDKKTVKGEIPVKLCNYTDVYYNTEITQRLPFMKASAKQTEIDKYSLKTGDVIITKDSETPGDIAISALVSENLNGVVCGYHLAIIRPRKKLVDSAYLNQLLSMPKIRYYFFTLATGVTRFGLSIGAIQKAHFNLPSLDEQQKIAFALSYADKEIEALKQKLTYLTQEKKALMQQLLTGKRRIKINEAFILQGELHE